MKIKDDIVTIKTVEGHERNFPVRKIRDLTTYTNEEEPYETVYCLSYEVEDDPHFIFSYIDEIEISEEDFDKVKQYLDNYEDVEYSETITINTNYTFK